MLHGVLLSGLPASAAPPLAGPPQWESPKLDHCSSWVWKLLWLLLLHWVCRLIARVVVSLHLLTMRSHVAGDQCYCFREQD